MVKKKQPTARIARKKKTEVEEHFDDKGMVVDKVKGKRKPKETEELFEVQDPKTIEMSHVDNVTDADLDIFMGKDLESLDSTDILMAVKESSKKKKDVTEFIPEEFKNLDLRNEVVQLVRNISTNQFHLGKLLYYIDVNELYREWGYQNFSKYLVSNEVGNRRLRYLVDLHKWFITDIKDPEKIDAIKELGWSKAKEIQRVATDSKALDMWIDCATNMNLLDLTDAVRIELEKKKVTSDNRPVDEIPDKKEAAVEDGPETKEELKMWSCKLYPEEYEIVNRMMEVAKKETKSSWDGRNLALVAQEFLMDADLNSGNREDNIKKYLTKIEERFDIRLIAIDNKADKVFFGAELLDGV
jgi:hypothetical protein